MKVVIRHGLQGSYLSLKRHVEGEQFPSNKKLLYEKAVLLKKIFILASTRPTYRKA